MIDQLKLWVAEQLDYWKAHHPEYTTALIVLKDLLLELNRLQNANADTPATPEPAMIAGDGRDC